MKKQYVNYLPESVASAWGFSEQVKIGLLFGPINGNLVKNLSMHLIAIVRILVKRIFMLIKISLPSINPLFLITIF